MSLTLPHSVETERALLGAILLSPNKIYDAVELNLTPEDFYLPKHQYIFQAMLDLNRRGTLIDPVQLTTDLDTNKTLEQVGGPSALVELAGDFFNPQSARDYIKTIQSKARLRKMFELFRDLSQEALESGDDEGLLLRAQSELLNLFPDSNGNTAVRLPDVIFDEVELLTSSKTIPLGLTTGFMNLDSLSGGFSPGQLVIIAGRPAMGKSALASSIIHNLVDNKRVDTSNVIYFSLEMTKTELARRSLSSLSRVNSTCIRDRVFTSESVNAFLKTCESVAKYPGIIFDDKPNLTTQEIRARCQKYLLRNKKLDLVIIDYLQLITSKGKSNWAREREVSEISRDLKNLAKELNVPIIALSQLNRDCENREDKRPKVSDLRESGSLEQDADIVCLLYRDEVYNPNTDDRGSAELIIAKNRNGKTGTIKLQWSPEYSLFENSRTPFAVNY